MISKAPKWLLNSLSLKVNGKCDTIKKLKIIYISGVRLDLLNH